MTSRREVRKMVGCTVALLALLGHAAAQGNSATDRLQRAIALNSIDDPQLKSWHLKLTFQLFDVKGLASEKGTIEEWWVGPSAHKTVYTSPSYSGIEISTEDGLYRSKGMTPVPDFLELVLQQVVHPLPSEKTIAGAELSLQQHDFGKTEMDCIMQAQKVQNLLYPPLGFSPTYCLDHAQDSLRISYDFSSLMTARNQLGVFQGRKVVLDQATNLGSVVAITAHLDTLQEVPLTAGDLTPSADLEKADHKPVAISSGVATGLKISGEPPIYPDSAKRDHVSGSVVLAARIGRDGRIHSLGIISTPRTDLAIASIAAVRQWTFKSFLLNGTPVDVETQLTVNFNFGPASTHLY